MHRYAGPSAVILVATVACMGGAAVASTWHAPEVRQLEFRRSVTTFVSTDPAMRRAVEDRMATQIPGSFPAYSAAPDLSITDPAKAREQLRRRLFDGVVVARVVDIRSEKANALGERWASAHPTFKGYWSSSWTQVRDPAYLTTTDGAMLEVRIFSLADDRLVWAGRAGSVKPQPVRGLVDHSVDVVVRELFATQMLR